MIKEILKVGVWYVFNGRADFTSVVTNALETNGIFQFAAPFVNLQILDTEALYRPGGARAVTYGDDIRVWDDARATLLFSGFVDRGVEWIPDEGCVRFTAIGWLAKLKEIKLGRDTHASIGGRYRYRRVINEPNLFSDAQPEYMDYEYIVFPYTYETLWVGTPEKRIGYKKVWLFDTNASILNYPRVFVEEGLQKQYIKYSPNGYDLEFGVYRRRMVDENAIAVSYSDIISEIAVQISGQFTASVIYDPGEIDVGSSSVIGNRVYDDIVWDSITPINIAFPVYCGYTRESSFAPFGGIDVVRIANIDSPTVIVTLARHVVDDNYVNQEVSNSLRNIRVTQGGIDYDRIDASMYGAFVLRKATVHISSDKLLIYNLWSWIVESIIMPTGTNDRQTVYQRYALVEFFAVDIPSGGLESNGSAVYSSLFSSDILTNWLSIALDIGNVFTGAYDEIVPQAVDRTRHEIVVDGFRYFSVRGLPVVESDTLHSTTTVQVEDVTAADFLLEICKLTNSVFYVGVDNNDVKTIYVVDRFYSSQTVDLRGGQYGILSRRQIIDSHIGEDAPKISSAIISNDAFNKAISAFYEDEYFPNEEEVWELTLIENSYSSALKLLDGIIIDEVTGTPLVISELRIGGGLVQVTARRAR